MHPTGPAEDHSLARADGDGMRRPPGHIITRAGREECKEVMRKGGGEEVRSVRCMCDVCAAHGDRAAVGVDVDAQGSGLREDESHFPLNARVECCAFVSERIWFALARRKGGSRRLSR